MEESLAQNSHYRVFGENLLKMGFYLDTIGDGNVIKCKASYFSFLDYSTHSFADEYSRVEKQVLYKNPLPGMT